MEKKEKKQKKSLISQRTYRLLSGILLLTAPVFAAARTVMMLTIYEPDAQYFKYRSPWPTVFSACLAAVVLAAVVFSCFLRSEDLPAAYPERSSAHVFSALLAGLMMIVNTVYCFIRPATVSVSSEASGYLQRFTSVNTVTLVLSGFVVLYMFFSAFPGLASRNVRTVLGFGVTVYFISRLLALYYDVSSPINSPVRIIDQLACVAAMLFFIGETSLIVGGPKPRYFVPAGTAAILLLLSSSVSWLVSAANKIFEFDSASIFYFVMLALALYITVRLLTYLYSGDALPDASGDTPAVSAEPGDVPADAADAVPDESPDAGSDGE